MKKIKYCLAMNVNCGTDEAPEMEKILSRVELEYSEENLTIARKEAYGGEYTVEDDGAEKPAGQMDIIEAQAVYTAMMTDTLLEV